MKIQKAYKVELKPNNKQITHFLKACGTARFAYNWGLNRRIEHYKLTGKTLSYIEQNNEFNKIKDSKYPWVREVSKWIPSNAMRNLDKAFKNFFRRLKNKEKPGFPKFKNKRRGIGSFSVNDFKIFSSKIRLPIIGLIRLKEHNYIPTENVKFNSATISERAGRWFVSVQVEQNVSVKLNNGPKVGIDVGLKTFATISDGSSIDNPKFLNRNLKRLAFLQRMASKKKKGSNNQKRAFKKVAKLHRKISNQRNHFLHNETCKLTKTKSCIVVEDLNISGMVKNRCLSRSVSDASWGEFIRQLKYKSGWYGSSLLSANRFFPSTKTCHRCGAVKKEMPLSDRTFVCECGLSMDRDLNAAINLSNLSTGESPGFQALGDAALAVSANKELSLF